MVATGILTRKDGQLIGAYNSQWNFLLYGQGDKFNTLNKEQFNVQRH